VLQKLDNPVGLNQVGCILHWNKNNRRDWGGDCFLRGRTITIGSGGIDQKTWVLSDLLLLLIAFCASLLNLVKLSVIASDSWDTTIPENAVVYSILAIAGSDHALYRDFSQFPYTTTPYAPLFYLFAGWLAKLFGGSVAAAYFAGRAVSLFAFGICLKLVYSLARRAGALPRSACFAVLLACGLPIIYPWAASCRPDFLAVAFSLWGMSLVRFDARGLQRKVLFVWIAAFFVKPSFITGPTAWTLYLLARKDWKAALQWAVCFGLAVGNGLVLAEWLSGGKYFANVIMANVAQPSWEGLRELALRKLIPVGAIVFSLGMMGALLHWTRSRKEPTFANLLSLFAVISTILFCATALKPGAAENYFFEPLFLWAALTAPLMDYLRRWTTDSRRIETCLVIVILCALVWTPISGPVKELVFGPVKELEWIIQKPERKELNELIGRTPGEILFISNGLGMRLGRGVTIHDGYNASYLETEGKISLASFAQRIKRGEFSAILAQTDDEYYGYTVLPQSFLEPVARNYREEKVFWIYRWLRRREHPLPSHVPKYPPVAGPETVVFRAKEYSDKQVKLFEIKNGGILLETNGWLEKEMEIPRDGKYQLDLYAQSSEFPGVSAQAKVSVGKELSHVFTIDPPIGQLWISRFSARGWIRKGRYPVRIEFINDKYQPPDDLNLLVDRLEISPVAKPGN
jgi:Predicted membrane protein (DUF2142)